jgi:hemolysin III
MSRPKPTPLCVPSPDQPTSDTFRRPQPESLLVNAGPDEQAAGRALGEAAGAPAVGGGGSSGGGENAARRHPGARQPRAGGSPTGNGGSPTGTGGSPTGSEGLPDLPDHLVGAAGQVSHAVGQVGHAVGQVSHAVGQVGHAVGQARHTVSQVGQTMKPKLRGWLHAGTFPVAVAAGIVLVSLAPSNRARISAAIFSVTAALLFGVSAAYHRGRWSPQVTGVLKRLDHANIFLIIAGTYTPFSVLLLPPGPARVLLWVVWSGAILGVVFRVLWVHAPRWLYVPVYVALGWVAVAYLPDFLHGGIAAFVLVVVGGVLYTTGGLIYGLKRPNPSPRWFGFHEVFHALTVAAFVSHYVGLSLVVYSSPSS